MDPSSDELTLRELVGILRRKRNVIVIVTLLSVFAALLYLTFFAQNVYASAAVISVYPSEVRASLEKKIQLEPVPRITAATLKVLLPAQETLVQVARKLKEEKRSDLQEWSELSEVELADRLHETLKANVLQPEGGTAPHVLTAELNVQLHDPELAAAVANAWAEVAVRAINRLPKAHIEATVEAFAQQIAPARDAYQEAQEAMRDFRRSTNLEAWKRELTSRISRGIELDRQIEELTRKAAEKRDRIAKITQVLANERMQLTGHPDPGKLLFQNRSLSEAQSKLARQADSSKRSYDAAAGALREFRANMPLARWKTELHRYLDRIGTGRLRLETVTSEKQRTQAQLDKVNELITATPDRIVLQKSLAADPELLALIGSDLASSQGLTLNSEVVNSVHTRLLVRRNELLGQLASLTEEERALHTELSKLEALADKLRRSIAEAETKRDRLELQLQVARDEHLRWARLAASYQNLEGDYHISPDHSYYQNLRTSLLNEEINLTALESALKGLKRSFADNKAAVASLKERVSDAELEEERLQETLRLAKEAFLALTQKQTDLNIELASLQESLAHVFARAYPDPQPVAPRRGLVPVLAALLGLMFGVFYAFLSAAMEEPVDSQHPKDNNGTIAQVPTRASG